MNKYYWLCSYPLESGSVINSGNWGRIIKKYNPQRNQKVWVALREYIFEVARLNNFSDKPSRLESLFLCENQNDLNKFKDECGTGRIFDLAYEVEIVDDNPIIFRTDWQLANIDWQNETIKSLENKALKYWNPQENINNPEILTTSKIKIIKEIL